jgi:hypothetical protein
MFFFGSWTFPRTRSTNRECFVIDAFVAIAGMEGRREQPPMQHGAAGDRGAGAHPRAPAQRRALMAGAAFVAAGLLFVAAISAYSDQVCALSRCVRATSAHAEPSSRTVCYVAATCRALLHGAALRGFVPAAYARAVHLLAVSGVELTHRDRKQGPVVEKSKMPQVAQTAIPNGKYYLMKMIRRQVAMKQRQAKEKAEHKNPLKVHILRSYKQVLADRAAHPAGSKSKLKALAEAKLKKAKVLTACCLALDLLRSTVL